MSDERFHDELLEDSLGLSNCHLLVQVLLIPLFGCLEVLFDANKTKLSPSLDQLVRFDHKILKQTTRAGVLENMSEKLKIE